MYYIHILFESLLVSTICNAHLIKVRKTEGAINNGQSTGNSRYTRHRTMKNKTTKTTTTDN